MALYHYYHKQYKGMMKMNGYRIARQYIERLNDKDLFEMWKVSKDDIEYEAVIIHYLIECEMERRKLKIPNA